LWTRESLNDLVKEKLSDYLLIIVSNREPYIHTYSAREVTIQKPASGLTVALDPVMQACGGTWVASATGDADKEVVDINNKVRVPADDPRYSLRRVWLSREQEAGYYSGFSNGALWPICHLAYTRPVFNESDWNTYKEVNALFADQILSEANGRKAFVFVQDYHLALLPRMLKEKNPDLIVAQFWHIPWPNPEAFRICPWQEEILKGMLGNDLLGFHIRYHCNNFLDTVDRSIECRIDKEREEITRQGKKTAVRSFPISVDFEELEKDVRTEAVTREMNRLKEQLGIRDKIIGIGLDRIDYTKGIPDRLRAIDRFFSKYPQYLEKVVFLQAGVASRTEVGAYQHLNEEIDEMVTEINFMHSTDNWKPIIYSLENKSPTTLLAMRRMADFCIVSSLHDGMNLVAKEFVACRFDEDGVLILSPFTGASRELSDALLVNPYATDHFAEAIKTAVEMQPEERRKRMRRMRETVKENNIYKWAADIINELVKIEFGG
jgi:alpha,alpha-trehalose-phosphate synthase [UDP-forming]